VNIATGTNRVGLGPRPSRVAADGGSEEEEMVDVEEQEEMGDPRDVTKTETETEIPTTTETETETET